MKKLLKLLLLLILIISSCSACSAKTTLRTNALCRYVVQADITCRDNGQVLHRKYTNDEKIEVILLYLRTLEKRGKVTESYEVNFEKILENSEVKTEYEILLTFSDSNQKIYQQKGDKYLSVDNGYWENIMPKQGHRLSKIFKLLPSD